MPDQISQPSTVYMYNLVCKLAKENGMSVCVSFESFTVSRCEVSLYTSSRLSEIKAWLDGYLFKLNEGGENV